LSSFVAFARTIHEPTAARCPGAIETAIEPWPRRIEWWCPVCGDSGSVFGWEWTRWNRMDLWGRGRKVVKKRKRKMAA
jgi:hypothetical protein